MSSTVRRVKGKPNRGGGRGGKHNSAGRGSGSGRGRGNAKPGFKPSHNGQRGGGGGGSGGRGSSASGRGTSGGQYTKPPASQKKQTFSIWSDDDDEDDFDDDFDDVYADFIDDAVVVNQSQSRSSYSSSRPVPSSGSYKQKNEERKLPQKITDSSSRPSAARPPKFHGDIRKVKMQKLHMQPQNQEMVRDVLHELQGQAFMSKDLDEYEDSQARKDGRFWMEAKQLQIQEFQVNSVTVGNTEETYTEVINKYSMRKLLRYGFHKYHCLAALEASNGELDIALEALLTQCFLYDSSSANDKDLTSITTQSFIEQRQEEALALSSIYGEDFLERIPNHVWVLKLQLRHMNEFVDEQYRSKIKAEKKSKPLVRNEDICEFFLRGNCRYGTRCRKTHDKAEEKSKTSFVPEEELPDNKFYELEIRFPDDNKYPYEPPLVAFLSTNDKLPYSKCLNISKRLFQEAVSYAENDSPSVFGIVSVLEDEGEVVDMLMKTPLPLSQATIVDNLTLRQRSNQKKDVVAETEDKKNQPPDVEKNEQRSKRLPQENASKSTKDYKPTQYDPKYVERENRKLKDKFKKTKTSNSYLSMLSQRQNLPAWSEQDKILKILKNNQVVVVSGMTGCGKTTQVPQFILDASLKEVGPNLCNIVCTQPRRISAIAVAERVANERADRIKGIVGYQIRLENMQSSSTRLLFCTTGILLRRLEGDFSLDGITHVIVDEVHERSEESDFLIMILRNLLEKRKDLKVILMSATLNAELFSNYFGGCPVIDIPGKTFPVQQYFLEDAIEFTRFVVEENSAYSRPVKRKAQTTSESAAKELTKGNFSGSVWDEVEEAMQSTTAFRPPEDHMKDWNITKKQLAYRYAEHSNSTIKSLSILDHDKINYDLIEELIAWIVEGDHEFPKEGAILVFLPGLAEITTLFDRLKATMSSPKSTIKYKLVPLHSSLSSEDQNSVFEKAKDGFRKVVISTNIAETSVTIDDVVFVIDAGKMKEKRYDSSKSMESLETTWVSQANALQRKGRAGRVMSGVAFHMFTSHTFRAWLREQPIPEIQRVPLEQVVLKIKMLKVFNGLLVKTVFSRLLEPPPDSNISDAITRLCNLGALNKDQQLTALGYHLASLPVDVRIGKLMLFGAIFRCLDPVLTIAAVLSYRSPFVAPFGKKEEADKKRKEFAEGNSDHITLLKAYKGWATVTNRKFSSGFQYCHANFLSIKTLQMLASMKHQFAELLSDIGFISENLSAKRMDRMAGGRSDVVAKSVAPEANINAENNRLVIAVLCAALYPNIVQVMTPESKFSQTKAGSMPLASKVEQIRLKTQQDGYVSIHPSSVNFQVGHFESPYLIYHEKIKTSKVYIRDCSMVSVYPLLLFGGYSLNLDLVQGTFIMSIDDGWIKFQVNDHKVGEMIKELRSELDLLMTDKIEDPSLDLMTCPRGSRIIAAIVQLITTQ
ncbi:putative ATP-dependent RNA helicase DHX57 [Antedon mediterranea]|uniref:putative ATP-dependent RNA helicase DHX57 n=1 Tax=Antedon mediterranea TaxID=105859 RepID=UPI003AF7DF81